MGQPELTDLGRTIAAQEDRAVKDRLDHARGRARLLEASIPRRAPLSSSRAAKAIGALALVAGVLLGVGVWALRRGDPLRFEVAGESGSVGAWIAAPETAARELRFSDGSDLHLGAGSRARVMSLDADGAEVALEDGSLEVSVVHREHTHWKVRGGPFVVHVIGTKFRVSWDPKTEAFDVALSEGAVKLSGPVVGEARVVHRGEELHVTPTSMSTRTALAEPKSSPDSDPPHVFAAAPPPEPDAGSEIEAPSPPKASASLPVHSAKPSASEVPAEPVSSWRSLARDARYKDAVAAVGAEGIDAILGSANAADLLALGDAERLGGGPYATRAYMTVRARFAGSSEAAASAFILGRMAQDRAHDLAGAVGWFTVYLREAPGGPWAADASGRIVEATDRMGDAAGAERAARLYIAAYPTGAHAAFARQVIARTPSVAHERSSGKAVEP